MATLFEEAFAQLNPAQREAVETLDGPVLVIAGPGTGKTQLLSLRVANILIKRDVSPCNILCLTFTNAGATAMRERLASFIGRAAYEVKIETFHSFAQSLRRDYAEFFERGVFDKAITSLEAAKLINQLLKELPVTDPLYQNPFEGVSGNLGTVRALIGKIKKSGLSVEDLLAICEQNTAFFDYFETKEKDLLTRMSVNLQSGTKAEKQVLLDELKAEILFALDSLPPPLTRQILSLTGSYEPYALLLKRTVQETEFYDDKIKTTAYRDEIRGRFFKDTPLRFKEREVNAATPSVVKLYKRYQAYLTKNALYDFDDMILDVNFALERTPEFAALLRKQYSYILIDEFQDTNGAQMKIVESIVRGKAHPNILAVGDDDQAIMRFQGASVEFIRQFESNYKNTKVIILKQNYRSVPEIVELAENLSNQIEERLEMEGEGKQLQAVRTNKKPLDYAPRMYASSEVQYYQISKEIEERIDTGFMEQSKNPGSEIAVIARKHDSLKKLIPYLEHREIAFNYRVRREVSQIASLQTLFSLMRFTLHLGRGVGERAEVELPRIVAAAEVGLDASISLELACEARKTRSWITAMTKSRHAEVKELFQELSDAAAQVAAVPVHEAILLLAQRSIRYYRERRDQDPYAALEFHYGLSALLNFSQGELEAMSPRRRQDTGLQDPLRLAYVMDLLEQSERFGIEISVEIPVVSEQAITLTTAHNSKGLEYDTVYLIDADRDSWKKRGGGARLVAQNIYLSEKENLDDFRRLLFVAATRARDELCVSLAGTHLVPELLGLAEPVKVETNLEDIENIAPLSWDRVYFPKGEDLKQATAQIIAQRKLSVSMLNAFVEYKNNPLTGESFYTSKMLSLPGVPSLAADFGTIMHSYLAGYLDEVVKAGAKTEEELIYEAKDAFAALDYPEYDLLHLKQRFDIVIKYFMPHFKRRLNMHAMAEQKFDIDLEGIPLTGRIDLLLKDPKAKTISIYDYKSGAAKSSGKQGSSYLRQLQFYKLLIEKTPEYKDWRVRGGANIFIEPDRKNNFAVAEEEFVIVDDKELGHLVELIKAVWHRLQKGLFDTTDFLKSNHLAELRAASVYKSASDTHKKGDPKEPSTRDIQVAYERWLIDDYSQGVV